MIGRPRRRDERATATVTTTTTTKQWCSFIVWFYKRVKSVRIVAMTEEFPGTLVGPSSKERKYDRQLRLWAASGQQALEDAQVLLVNSDGSWGGSQEAGNSGVVGVETLKNLVLPGIGGFTIVDPATVTETDLGVNFFLEEESLGKSRAEETCRLLRELNPDVQGSFETKVR